MSDNTRREFLRVSGTLLGGIAIGTQVVAAERTDRFIVETKGHKLPGDLEVVHELPGVKYAVVAGSEDAVKKSKRVKTYEPDVEIELDDPDANDEAPTVAEAEDVTADSAADEEFLGFQWDKQFLDVETAHDTATGEGTRVAIIDSGVAAGHPDLEVNEGLSRNFTGDGLGAANPAGGGHGTHVAGIAAAEIEGTEGVAGTAPDADIVDCRVFSPSAAASFGDVIAAVLYSAAIDADVANLSLGAYPVPRQGNGQFYGKVLNKAMTHANREGTLLVVAAGNDSADLQHDKGVVAVPAEGAQALTVAATGPIGYLWDADGDGVVADFAEPPESPAHYTNYGTNAITVAAPGGDFRPEDVGTGVTWYFDGVLNTYAEPTYATDSDGTVTGIESVDYGYAWLSGTSMAAPQVAGAAALLNDAADLNTNQVESIVKRTASVPEGFEKPYYGSGLLDLVGAVEEAAEKSTDGKKGKSNGKNSNGKKKGH